MPAPYSIDTSALIDWWVRYYPPKVFKGLVPRMEQLIADGRLRATREVREEIEREDDELFEWAKGQGDLWLDSDEAIQGIVAELMAAYHNPDKPDKGINGADPFVIAVAAISFNPEPGTVVSAEKPGSEENPNRGSVHGSNPRLFSTAPFLNSFSKKDGSSNSLPNVRLLPKKTYPRPPGCP